jgi:hypothetical protein
VIELQDVSVPLETLAVCSQPFKALPSQLNQPDAQVTAEQEVRVP